MSAPLSRCARRPLTLQQVTTTPARSQAANSGINATIRIIIVVKQFKWIKANGNARGKQHDVSSESGAAVCGDAAAAACVAVVA